MIIAGEWTLGVDVAHWQGHLIMAEVAKAKPVDVNGNVMLDKIVEYIDIKTTHGAFGVDERFEESAENSAGVLLRGFYAWFVPGQNPIAQADFFVDAMKSFQLRTDMPPWVDFEQDDPAVRGLALRLKLRAMVERIEDRLGRQVCIYTGRGYWQLACKDADDEWFASRPLAHAEYHGHVPRDGEIYKMARPWELRDIDATYLQFDGNNGLYLPASCSNVNHPVDCDFDRFKGNRQRLTEFCEESWDDPKQHLDERPPDWMPQTSPATVLPGLVPLGDESSDKEET